MPRKSTKVAPEPVAVTTEAEAPYIYGLRTVDAKRRAHGRFQWPKFEMGEPIIVRPTRWIADEECGNGIHFCAWGEEDTGHFDMSDDAVWQVVRTNGPAIGFDGKHKAERVELVFDGKRDDAVAFLQAVPEAAGRKIHFATVSGGDGATVSGGDGAIITITWWDGTKERYRRFIAEVGENGIEPNIAYRVDENGHPYKVYPQPAKAKA